MSRSTDTWCWQCGDPINCAVDRYQPGAYCPYGPGKAVGLHLQAKREADEKRLREIIREEIAMAAPPTNPIPKGE